MSMKRIGILVILGCLLLTMTACSSESSATPTLPTAPPKLPTTPPESSTAPSESPTAPPEPSAESFSTTTEAS